MKAPERILVVEDDEMMASVLERYLVRDGFEVQIVGDGGAALGAIDEFEPDLVILGRPSVRARWIQLAIRRRTDVRGSPNGSPKSRETPCPSRSATAS